jgi:hypothetical protein
MLLRNCARPARAFLYQADFCKIGYRLTQTGQSMTPSDNAKYKELLLANIPKSTEAQLKVQLENAKRKLPESQWLVDAISNYFVEEKVITTESVREILVRSARIGKTITYKEIGDNFGEWTKIHYKLTAALGPVGQYEEDAGRPMLTSIVVDAGTGMCGKGFFDLAKAFGRDFIDEDAFQSEERTLVFEYWKNR